LNYKLVGKLQGQNNLKIPFKADSSAQPASSLHHPPQLSPGQHPEGEER